MSDEGALCCCLLLLLSVNVDDVVGVFLLVSYQPCLQCSLLALEAVPQHCLLVGLREGVVSSDYAARHKSAVISSSCHIEPTDNALVLLNSE